MFRIRHTALNTISAAEISVCNFGVCSIAVCTGTHTYDTICIGAAVQVHESFIYAVPVVHNFYFLFLQAAQVKKYEFCVTNILLRYGSSVQSYRNFFRPGSIFFFLLYMYCTIYNASTMREFLVFDALL